ncbi:unnamed protein product [Moneuplotes crassus]|uniref:Uncharacterized protein n=1 Tax=Euplotes crassus TaxID=5936 RepID=A0AAD1XXC4_EUPCR|nr:unnamed protein product [Moneuplotes crassus]
MTTTRSCFSQPPKMKPPNTIYTKPPRAKKLAGFITVDRTCVRRGYRMLLQEKSGKRSLESCVLVFLQGQPFSKIFNMG